MAKEWRTRRLSRRYVLILGSMLALLAFAATASGNLTGSTFDGGDGNLVVNDEAKDWANIGIVCETAGCALDEPTGSTDDSFGEGTSENDDPPSVVDGSIPNNKSDLTRFYVANEKASGKDFLYLAWERVQEPTGTTNMDFEFNIGTTVSSNGITPVRMQGDLLIKYDLSQGGTNPTLGFHRWQTQAGNPGATTPSAKGAICEAGNKFPCWGKVQSLAGNFEGAVNTAAVDDPINPDATRSLSPRTFGEAAINLTDSGLFPAGQCTSFGSGYLKSRSSDSFTAAIKDFIAPIPVNISNCGSITIKKETSPQLGTNSPNFPFTASGGTINPTSFNLKDDGSQAYTTLLAGSYTFTEGALPTGWDFDKIECTKTGSSTITENETAGARNVVIGLAADDTVVCTFFNNERPQVKVVKTVVGDANARFDLKIDSTVFDNSGAGFGTTTTGSDFQYVATGSHSVSEVAHTGTSLTNFDSKVECDSSKGSTDPGTSHTFSVTYGDKVTCTITNSRKPQIKVIKTVVGDANARFDLKIDSTVFDNAGAGFGTTTIGSDFQNVTVGSHSVSEVAHTGTDLTNFVSKVECDSAKGSTNPGTSHTFGVAYGDKVTCTITNTRRSFTLSVFVCETTNGTPTLYRSDVTLPATQNGTKTKKPPLTGVSETDLCNLGGASYTRGTGTYSPQVVIGTSEASP